jgi:uncharacterized protein
VTVPPVSATAVRGTALLLALLLVRTSSAQIPPSQTAPATRDATPAIKAEPAQLDRNDGRLYGTIELPASKPPYPVVLLIAGSGPTDRDGNSAMLAGKINGTKMLAEGLAAHGIASLRYDKRLIGQSTSPNWKEEDVRFDMYVDDAVAWGEYLRKDSRFRGLIVAGHSEGALIGMLAAPKLAADGYVSIAGTGRPLGEELLRQVRARPMPAETLKQIEDGVRTLQTGHTIDPVPAGLEWLFRPSLQPFEISLFKYDPAHEIAKLKLPVLILQGNTDMQVSVQDAQLLAGADPAAKLVVIDGMNHILKHVPTDKARQIASYSDPSLPLDARLLDEMLGWINGLNLR